MKVLISDNLAKEGVEILEQAEGIEVDVKVGLSPQELKEIIRDYHGLVIRSATKVTAEIIAAADNLKVIGRAGSGLDNVDIPAATKRNIAVMNTPGGNTISVAEHTISLMLSLARHVPQSTSSVKAGKWEKKKFMGMELNRKTLGIIGIGNVGAVVADRAQGLKMKVIAHDPLVSEEKAREMGVELISLDELFKRADIITIHAPLTDETRGLINAAAFEKMKDGVLIVNCARGGIVIEEDLCQAIQRGKVRGAALDVFEKEPPGSCSLLEREEVICTSHLGASTEDAQINVAI
ncbi:MAG: phosphoglycerate dehydrogenase, partial [Deltaproteobacteria bacterium]